MWEGVHASVRSRDASKLDSKNTKQLVIEERPTSHLEQSKPG